MGNTFMVWLSSIIGEVTLLRAARRPEEERCRVFSVFHPTAYSLPPKADPPIWRKTPTVSASLWDASEYQA